MEHEKSPVGRGVQRFSTVGADTAPFTCYPVRNSLLLSTAILTSSSGRPCYTTLDRCLLRGWLSHTVGERRGCFVDGIPPDIHPPNGLLAASGAPRGSGTTPAAILLRIYCV
jgi:hypothetical protein